MAWLNRVFEGPPDLRFGVAQKLTRSTSLGLFVYILIITDLPAYSNERYERLLLGAWEDTLNWAEDPEGLCGRLGLFRWQPTGLRNLGSNTFLVNNDKQTLCQSCFSS